MPGLREGSVEFAAGGVEGALVFFRAVVNEGTAVVLDCVAPSGRRELASPISVKHPSSPGLCPGAALAAGAQRQSSWLMPSAMRSQ